MALPFIFANLAAGNQPASDLDTNFNAVANMGIYRCTAAGTNIIALTTAANQPGVTSYTNNQAFWFTAANTSTGAVTLGVNAAPVLNVYRQDGVAAGSGDILIGAAYEAYYISTLNSGVGGFQLAQSPIQTVTAPSFVLLNTLTASNSAALVDTTSITSTYNTYLFTFTSIVPVTNAVKFMARISIDGGATYKNTAYIDLSTNTDGIYISGNTSTISSGGSVGLYGHMEMNGPSLANDKLTTSQSTFYTGTVVAGFNGGGFWSGGSQAINAIQFLMTSGNISTGIIKIYGIK